MAEAEVRVDEIDVGVEEEFFLVDDTTGELAPRIDSVIKPAEAMAGDQAQAELHRAQIELASTPCHTLDALRSDLLSLRGKLVTAAASRHCSVVASGTYPGKMGRAGRLITPHERYEEMERTNQILVREQAICGCHIHVTAPHVGRQGADDEHAEALAAELARPLRQLAVLGRGGHGLRQLPD